MASRKPLVEARQDPRWSGGELVATALGTVHAVVTGDGPDVVLIHGITDSLLTWTDLRAEIEGVRVHAIDLPGHGLSDVPDAPLTPQQMAAWVAAYLDTAGVERAVVVGWSLGGGVAVELAAADPRRVRSLVLVAPAGVHMKVPFTLGLLTLPLAAEMMPWIGASQIRRRLAMRDTYGHHFRPSDAVLDRYYLAWEVAERARYIRALIGVLSFDDTMGRVASVSARATVIHGVQDRLVPIRAGASLAERLPNGRLEPLTDVGHSPHVERPDVVLGALREALAGPA